MPATAGTLPTHTPLFVALLASVVVIVGALAFFPALALGPIVEELQFFFFREIGMATYFSQVLLKGGDRHYRRSINLAFLRGAQFERGHRLVRHFIRRAEDFWLKDFFLSFFVTFRHTSRRL